MKAFEVLDLLDGTIKDAQQKNITQVDLPRLKAVVNELRRMHEKDEKSGRTDGPDGRMERFKADLDNWLEQQKRQHEWDVEMFRSILEAGRSALQACVLVNGGAAVALLAFLGHLTDKSSPSPIQVPIATAMSIYVSGVGLAAFGWAFRYLSQAFFGSSQNRWGAAFQIAAVAVGIGSLVAFAVASSVAYVAFVGGPAQGGFRLWPFGH